MRRLVMTAWALVAFGAVAGAQTAAPPRVRGTIEHIDGRMLTVVSREGEKVTVPLAADAVVTLIAEAEIGDIKPNSYIGTAAMPQKDGSLVAMEIHVFPERMRGAGEGHRPYDLQPQSTMTNGTVGDVSGVSGRTLTLKYKDGEKHVLVPPGTPIITYEPGNAGMLVAGAHVILTTGRAADGGIVVTRVALGKDGLVPPM